MRTTKAATVLALALLGAMLAVGVASAAPGNTNPTLSASAKLRKAVEPAGILMHQRRFQRIANANEDTRVSGTPGYDASAGYVAGKLEAAGYEVSVQPFEFPYFDMLGSPNFVRFVYDGDGSATPDDPGDAGPAGSAEIERVFKRYFAAKGLRTEPTPFDGRSDYGPFIAVGIPAGGLFSGAEGIKTAQQEDVYGGTAGEPYDPCYHQPCDDITNLSVRSLAQLSDGVAHATLTYAEDEELFVGPSAVGARSFAADVYGQYKGPEAVE
jgi:Zn-dependent M28 family amino/carboxypeptidase